MAAPRPSSRTSRTLTASSSRAPTWPRPPGRLPVGDGGQGAGRDGHPRRPAVHPHLARSPTCTCRSGPAPTSRSSAALVNHVLSNELDFREYVVAYTNAAAIIDEDFQDTEDLDGLFSGFDPETGHYDPTTWQYEGAEAAARQASATRAERAASDGAVGRAGQARTRPRSPRPRLRRRRRSTGKRRARRDAAAPALRLPDPQAALRPLHPGDGRSEVCGIAPGAVRAGGRAR